MLELVTALGAVTTMVTSIALRYAYVVWDSKRPPMSGWF